MTSATGTPLQVWLDRMVLAPDPAALLTTTVQAVTDGYAVDLVSCRRCQTASPRMTVTAAKAHLTASLAAGRAHDAGDLAPYDPTNATITHSAATLTRLDSCRSCGAPIAWASTAAGHRMPVDPKPVLDGNVVLDSTGGSTVPRAVVYRPGDPSMPSGDRYKSHFATCPNATKHRKKDRVGGRRG